MSPSLKALRTVLIRGVLILVHICIFFVNLHLRLLISLASISGLPTAAHPRLPLAFTLTIPIVSFDQRLMQPAIVVFNPHQLRVQPGIFTHGKRFLLLKQLQLSAQLLGHMLTALRFSEPIPQVFHLQALLHKVSFDLPDRLVRVLEVLLQIEILAFQGLQALKVGLALLQLAP